MIEGNSPVISLSSIDMASSSLHRSISSLLQHNHSLNLHKPGTKYLHRNTILRDILIGRDKLPRQFDFLEKAKRCKRTTDGYLRRKPEISILATNNPCIKSCTHVKRSVAKEYHASRNRLCGGRSNTKLATRRHAKFPSQLGAHGQ